MKWIARILFVGLLMGTRPATAQSDSYDGKARSAHIMRSLEAVTITDPETLENAHRYLDVTERNACKSDFHRLRVTCLIEAARRNCKAVREESKRRNCELYSDLIVVNKLSEKRFTTAAERYGIMKNNRNYRDALRKELWRRYASIATDFALSRHAVCAPEDMECLSRGIDGYCLEYTETNNLSWHHCASALTWFIATEKKTEAN